MAKIEEQLPREFGKYHLIEQVATGGMAQLYRAKLYGAGGFEKDLAVKKILPHLGQDEAFIQMFMDEAMITVTLNHGNIAQILDFGELDGEYFLVMEYIDGVDLQSLIKRSAEEYQPIPVQMAAYIVEQICRGLDYAHNKLGPDGQPLQIVHRDVSPQNVLISFEGQVKLVDFGIARAASRITSTQAGVVKGKVAYMSPEQLVGHDIDHRSDVFAAGIILYELLTHHRPFEGATLQETMAQISRGEYKPPQKLNHHVHRKLAAVVKKALERNPKKRYQSAGNMAAGLAAYLHSTGEPPTPMALAQLVRERLPDIKPRTIQPTPIRALRRDPTHPDGSRSTPPPPQPAPAVQAVEPLQTGPEHEPARTSAPPQPEPVKDFAPASAAQPVGPKRRTTAPNFPTASANRSNAPPIEVSEDQPVVVDADGEAVSFGSLGLPEEYVLEDAATHRPTDPQFPEQTDASRPEPAEADPDLLTAATRLLTQAPVPDLSAEFGSSADEEPTMVVPEKARDAQRSAANTAPAAGPAEPTAEQEAEAYRQDLLAAPTLVRPAQREPEARPAGVAAPAAASTNRPTPAAQGLETSDQFDAWMETDAQPSPTDFDDEAPFPPRKKSRRGPWLAIGAGLLLIGLIAGLVILNPFGAPASDAPQANLASLQPPGPATGPVPGEPPAGHATPATDQPGDQPPPATDPEAHTPPQPGPAPAEQAAADAGQAGPPDQVQPAGPVAQPPEPALVPPDKPADLSPDKKPVKRTGHRARKKRLAKAADRPSTPPPEAITAKGSGTLRINSEPFSVVYLGNRKIGPTPQMAVRLPAGSHTLTLRNEALGIEKRVRVRIEADKVHTVFVELTK